MKRDHASLCSYNPKQKQNLAVNPALGSVAGVKRGRSPGSENSRRDEDRWPRTTGEFASPFLNHCLKTGAFSESRHGCRVNVPEMKDDSNLAIS